MTQYPVILAIDYGTQRVGLAISRGSLAEPLTILPNTDHLLSDLIALIEAERVEKIVVGLSENLMAEKSKAFAAELQQRTPLPLVFMDETLSSHAVATKLKDMGASLQARQRPLDDRAAAEFLQEYLDGVPSSEI